MSWFLEKVAEDELNDAAGYYFSKAGTQIGNAFLDEFERSITLIDENQKLGTIVKEGLRIHPFRRFPYSIVYRETPRGPVIYAIAHQHRRPNYWADRLP